MQGRQACNGSQDGLLTMIELSEFFSQNDYKSTSYAEIYQPKLFKIDNIVNETETGQNEIS